MTFRNLCREPLPPQARTLVLKHGFHDHGSRMLLHAAVVMPEHVHLLLTPLRDQAGWPIPLAKILQLIKGTSAHSVNQVLGKKGPLWQDESFDHVLRSEESLAEKIEYIRQHPVRRGLPRAPEDYAWLWQEPVAVWRGHSCARNRAAGAESEVRNEMTGRTARDRKN